MMVNVEKITGIAELRRACSATMRGGGESKASLAAMYGTEHSPIRTQIFWIEMTDIPYSVSVHLSRHDIGVEHFVSTSRPDRGGDKENRYPNVNHLMLLNAQALLNICRERLCFQAESPTRQVAREIRCAVFAVDRDLYDLLYPKCVHLGRCPEIRECDAGVSRVAKLYDKDDTLPKAKWNPMKSCPTNVTLLLRNEGGTPSFGKYIGANDQSGWTGWHYLPR